MLLHYLVKVESPKMLPTLTAPQQTVDMFLRTLWGLDYRATRMHSADYAVARCPSNWMAVPTGTPANGVVECKGYEKSWFSQYIALSWKWCKIEP